jgi:hypothetical protein
MLLGTRLWYGFFGETLQSDTKFQKKMDELCREIGPPQQTTAVVAEPNPASSPASSSALAPKASSSASASTKVPPAVSASAAPEDKVVASHSPPNPAASTERVSSLAAPVSVSTTSTFEDGEDIVQPPHAPQRHHGEDIVQPPQPQRQQQLQLSEAFYLERERAAERAERERAERIASERIASEREFRLFSAVIAFSMSTCTCGIGAAILGTALLVKRT